MADNGIRKVPLVRISHLYDCLLSSRFMNNESALLNAILNVPYTAGETNTAGGLNAMCNLVFNQSFGDRPNVPNVAVIMTDGNATNPSTVQPAIDRAHGLNITTYAIGVTNAIDEKSLKQLASAPQQASC